MLVLLVGPSLLFSAVAELVCSVRRVRYVTIRNPTKQKKRNIKEGAKRAQKIYLCSRRGTGALWSSILPDWNLMMSEKKSSSGTVAPLFCVVGGGRSDSKSTAGTGRGERWSSSREPWQRTSWSRNESSGIVFRSCNRCRELVWRPILKKWIIWFDHTK